MDTSQARGLIKGLENWAKSVTSGYKDVKVTDMSLSFRDGLAFCAIIHHYRPDLIDFNSLSKENIQENNSLAFSTAEKQLGVPALLDAEDMVNYSRPDRLSIITYLSQLHNCFVNQNRVNASKGKVKIRTNSDEGPPAKVLAPSLLTNKRHEVCHTCNHRVFILERLMVDRKLYHTTCFRCNKCNNLLNPGAYVESDTPGFYECAVCLTDESSHSMDTSDSVDSRQNSAAPSPVQSPSPVSRRRVSPVAKSPLVESVANARNTFLRNSLSRANEAKSESPLSLRKSMSFLRNDSQTKESSPDWRNSMPSFESPTSGDEKVVSPEGGISVKDKISVFETQRIPKLDNSSKSSDTGVAKKLAINSSELESESKIITPPTSPSSVNSLDTPVKSPLTSLSSLNSLERPVKSPPTSPSSVNSLERPVKSPSIYSNSSTDLNTLPKSPLNASALMLKTPEKTATDSSTKKVVDDSLASPNGQQSCENTSSSILNKVPSPQQRYSLQLSKDTEKPKESMRFQVGEYKTPFKSSRDIFQTNITPLKLSIPTINSAKRELVKSSETSPLRADYPTTLPRKGSVGSLPGNQTIPRRSSLEYQPQNTVLPNTNKIESLQHRALQKEESKSLTDMNLENALSILTSGSSGADEKSKESRLSEIPVPKARHSLEMKRQSNFSKLDSTKPPVISSKPPESNSKSPDKVSDPKPVKMSDVAVSKPPPPKTSPPKEDDSSEVQYPDDLNPFGDDEEGEAEIEYPDDLNPFGDDAAEEPPPPPKVAIKTEDYDESKNPFADSDEEADSVPTTTPVKSQPTTPRPPVTPGGTFPRHAPTPSPTGSLQGTLKKRPAPKPPRISDIFPGQDAEVSNGSPSNSRKSLLNTPSPKSRRVKPAAPPPPVPRQASRTDVAASTKQVKESDNLKIKEEAAAPKKKKRPAPPVPIPKRVENNKIPLKEIVREMKEIEEKQRECERQGRELELLIRDRDKDEEPSIEEEEYIMQLFELVNQKNALFRRQAELMYIKRFQRLEEQQAELQEQIRELLMRPPEEKTEEDKLKEEMLILEHRDIVDQRNSIIDSIEMDRRRELEEDASVLEQIEMKNGDLPITAELKEKSSSKEKKSKTKKEKKEKEKKEKKEKKKKK